MKYYHIITQSYRGKNILPETEDCVAYLHLVAKSFRQYQVLWLAYAVMPTHIHLCVAMSSDDDADNQLVLAKARRKIACGYTAYARKHHPEWFHGEKRIFEKRNKLKFLQTPYDVRQLIRYIHLNPLRKELEGVPGETIRCSHQAMMSFLDSQDAHNPFNCFAELQKVRNALSGEEFFRLFGRNRNEQKQNYLALLAQPLTDEQSKQLTAQEARPHMDTTDKTAEFQKAELVLRAYFFQHYAFKKKAFTPENRLAFLRWLNLSANIAHKRAVVTYIAKRTALSSREIAEMLHIGSTTVKKILKGVQR